MRGIVRSTLALSVFLGIVGSGVFADQPAVERPYVTASYDGAYYFKMVPASGDAKPARGAAYEVMGEGPDRLIWSVSDWYSHQTFLSYDGNYLVRMGSWSFGGKPSAERMGVAFYKRGQLIKEHSIKDLVLDPSKAPKTVSFFHYLDAVGGFEPDLTTFTLTTCDGIRYAFDVKTGAIVSKKSVPVTSPMATRR